MALTEAGLGTYQPLVHSVQLPTTTVRVAEIGTGSPLLLVNGIGASLETWRPLAERLAMGRRVIMFDAPGAGRSELPCRPARMPALATMVVELLDALGETEVDVLGYSWGGALAQQLAHDAPERVRRLVLASTSPGLGGQPPSLAVLALMSSPLRYVSGGYLEWIAPKIYGGQVRRSGSLDPAHVERWLGQPPRQLGYAHQVYAISGWTSLPWLHELRQPTHVICGDDDPLVPARNARLLARRIPNAQLDLIPGGGHLWILESADQSCALIERSLSS